MTTFNFGAYEPAGKTARFELPIRGALVPDPLDPAKMIEGSPYVIVRHAGDSNKPYLNGVARLAAKAARAHRKVALEDQLATQIKEDREHDRELFPGLVVIGWGDLPGPDGSPVAYEHETCKAFCRELPDWIFDRLRRFSKNPQSFVTEEPREDEITEQDVVEIAGN